MKSAKELVFEYIQHEIYVNNKRQGVETREIASGLNMQRSNVSSIVNELVKENKLMKSKTRPVYYRLTEQSCCCVEKSCFTNLIGHNGSLKNAVQLAKAAILYPCSSLNVLLSSKLGCGTAYFASLMFQFAKEEGILNKDAPYVKVNCLHYQKNVEYLNDILFGNKKEEETNCFARAQGGMLFIERFDLLTALQQSRIFNFLETGMLYAENNTVSKDYPGVFLVLSSLIQNEKSFLNYKLPVIIELPELKKRPIQELYELINYFFSEEAAKSKRSIEVSMDAIKALLLHDFVYNLKEMELEIKAACANAYVRVVTEYEQNIYVCLHDFKSQMRKNLLNLKDHAVEINALVGTSEHNFYDKNTGYKKISCKPIETVYTRIKTQFDELSNRGVNTSSIQNVINTHIQNLFEEFSYYHDENDSISFEQMSKIVDKHIMELVKNWLDNCSRELERSFKKNVFYGLCLHINSLWTLSYACQRVEDEQIVTTVQNYPKEYALSAQFASLLKNELELDLGVDETVLLTMFLIEQQELGEEGHPVLLYIMHGKGTASSLMEVTNKLTFCDNAYGYDLDLTSESKQSMEEIKSMIMKINNGKGVIVIYDMGSIKTMLDTIRDEIDVKIRCLNIPITLIGIDIARKCAMETDIDYVYHRASMEVNRVHTSKEGRNKMMITLCHTGEGGAAQLKDYIDQFATIPMKAIALSISNREELLKEVLDLKKTYEIHAFVGTYNPKLLGIPFISITKIFENKKENINRILMFEPMEATSFDYNDIYNYLEEQFKYTSISKLKTVMPDMLDKLATIYSLCEDRQLGLFMHIACEIERILAGDKVTKNKDKNRILSAFEEDYRVISKIVRSVEKAFKIIFDEDEIATIIMIVKKI